MKLWKGFLEYERSNPQRLDATALTQRVELAFMQALMCLMHFPEVGAWGPVCIIYCAEVDTMSVYIVGSWWYCGGAVEGVWVDGQ